ncbi:pyridoxal-phosphate dependent enzyme, partial [Flavobacteriaceae bacterium]|nr:pyridoxal-phosphate dependent enzyme [Flavobacteriaceae bacterium]
MKEAYIVKAYRTAVGKAPKGLFRFKRPDELASETINHMMEQIPELDKTRIDDVIVGNATPEAEQGLNIGRVISLMGLKVEDVPGVTVNRYCASGLETIAMASAKIKSGMADCIIAGGVESMSFIPMGGYKPVPDYAIAQQGKEDYYWGMGLTAEQVAQQFNINREDQDEFALNSHSKAVEAISKGKFKSQIVPIKVEETYLDENGKKAFREYTVDTDEGPRKDTNLKVLINNPNIKVFCTATDGNHGKGLAWAAQKFSKKAIVFVPRDTSKNRIKAIKSYNAIVYQLDLNYEETCVYASKKCDENGWQLVQDASWENYEEIPSLIMSGYLTHFKEIEFPNNKNSK